MTTSKTASRITISIPGGEDSPNQVEMSLEASPTLANLSSIFNDLLMASMAANRSMSRHLRNPNSCMCAELVGKQLLQLTHVVLSRDKG